MKKFFLLPIMGLLFMACSVDNEDLNLQDNQINTLDAQINAVEDVEVCGESESHDFEEHGEIIVMNDESNLYVTVSSWNGSLANTKLHIADDFEDFPTVGQGNLPPGQMDYQVSFEDGEEHYTFTFPLNELDSDGCVYIASQTSFSGGSSSWAGDLEGNKGNWSYFEYCVQSCEVVEPPVCPGDIYNELCSSQITNPNLLGFENYFKNLVFANTDETAITGTFNPTIAELLEQYNQDGPLGTYSTSYTYNDPTCGEITIDVTVEVTDCN